MENNTITIYFGEENEVTLSTSNPDINSLVKTIVDSKGKINLEAIKVTSSTDEFDSNGFTSLMKSIVAKYLKALELENSSFDDAKKAICNN